jgi:hypothetical protein
MKPWLLVLASGFACTGCTTLALERHTLGQAKSVAELRYLEVLDNLALVAHDPAALPAYSSIFAGTAQVIDTSQFGSSPVWVAKGVMGTTVAGFLSETTSPQFSRSVSENWSLDPLLAPEKIEALRCACRWVVYGPAMACSSCPGLLATPEQSPTPGRHFGVADRLAHLPPGWLHVGHLKDVPLAAHYRAHCGNTWVWVMPDGMAGLADFTLVFEDIARVNINSPSLFYWPPPPCVYTRASGPEGQGKGKAAAAPAADAGFWPRSPVNDPNSGLVVSVYVDRERHVFWVLPYQPVRFENLGVDSSLRSQLSAAGAP